MTWRSISQCCAVLLICVLSTYEASAQFASPFAPPPPDAMDAVSGGSVGPNPAPYMNAARGVAQPAQPTAGSPFAAPPMGAPPAPTPAAAATPAPSYGYAYGNYGNYGGAAGQSAQPVTPTPTPIPTTTVLTGTRVTDAVSGELIDDARFIDVPQNEVDGKYFDDGTNGDEQAGDLVFTKIDERGDVIGAESHQVLVRLLNALQSANQLSPLEFYRLNVLTTEAISEIDNFRTKEAEKDKLLRLWAVRFVREFKKNPDDLASPFYDLYVVSPPQKPSMKIPVPIGDWKPPTSPQMKLDQAANATVGSGFGGYGGGGGYGGY